MVRPTLQVTSSCIRRTTLLVQMENIYYKLVYYRYNKLTAWLDLLNKLNRTVRAVPPASTDGKYYKLVYYNKLTAWLDLLYKLH